MYFQHSDALVYKVKNYMHIYGSCIRKKFTKIEMQD